MSNARPRRKVAGALLFGRWEMSNMPDDLVRKIRAEAKHWRRRVLAARYGISIRRLNDIVNRISYADVA